MAVCAREIGTFVALAVTSWIIHIFRNKIYLSLKFGIIIAIIGFLPIAIDGITQLYSEILTLNTNILPFYESSNTLRTLTGILMGTSVTFILFSLILVFEKSKENKIFKIYFFSVFISLILATVITAFSNFTSIQYKSENLFVDLNAKLPGYNYEIVENGAHTSNNNFRILKESTRTYCLRAKKYNQELFSKYCEL